MNDSPDTRPAFAELFAGEIRDARLPARRLAAGECTSPDGRRCSICHAGHLAYEAEADLRQRALDRYRNAHGIASAFDALTRSPDGRFYRSVSKRKLFRHGRNAVLGLIDARGGQGARPFPVGACAIEHRDHAPIYRAIQEWIDLPRYSPLAAVLRYAILKSGDRGHALILNLADTSSAVSVLAAELSRRVSKAFPAVTSVFILGSRPGKGRYYLDDGGVGSPTVVRRLYGPNQLSTRIGNRRFQIPPMGFTQGNPGTAAILTGAVHGLLEHASAGTLYDLYCGYGLFALTMADLFKHVVGVDSSGASIEAATENATRQGARSAKFLRRDITAESVFRVLQSDRTGMAVILDPPWGGPVPGVPDAIASREPSRVIHLWCNIDRVPRDLATWERCGYRAERIIPIDHFPGTDEVELVAALTPTRNS